MLHCPWQCKRGEIMYYRKYFSGTIDSMAWAAAGATSSAGAGNTATLYFRSLKTTPVLCTAIVDVLKEIGLNQAACSLDQASPVTYGEIFPYGTDKQGIQVFFGHNTVNQASLHISLRICLYPDSDVSAAKTTGNSYGSSMTNTITAGTTGTNIEYRFYVTIKGDPESFVMVFVGTYADPDAENLIFGFGKGRDCFGNETVCYAPLAYNNGLYFFDAVRKTYINKKEPVRIISNSQIGYLEAAVVKGCPDDTIALIPWMESSLLGVTLDNCYHVPVSLTTETVDKSFLIEGMEYWLFRYGRLLAKCPTKMQGLRFDITR